MLRYFEKRVLRRVFEPKTVELPGSWTQFMYLPVLFGLLYQGRVRRRGHVVDMEDGKRVCLILVEKAERNILNGVDVGGRIVFKYRPEQHRQDLSTCYEHTNEIVGSIKCREFLPSGGSVIF